MLTPSQQAARRLCENLLWTEALWAATTFRWHPASEAPPVMGLVFGDWRQGVNLFRSWTDDWGNADEDDDLRVAILEGDVPGQAPGYTVRISAALESNENQEGSAVGQVQRMHPIPGAPAMLPVFKREYQRHGEFLLAPVVMRDDEQLWFNVDAGIIKRELILRDTADIATDEPDAEALRRAPAAEFPTPSTDSLPNDRR